MDDMKRVEHEEAERLPGSGAGRIPASVRQMQIMEAIERHGFASVARVASDLNVSDMTVRRDLVILEEKGLLIRTHGGALAIGAGASAREVFDAEEPVFEQRRRLHADDKEFIAAAAARLIGPRETIGLDVGSTVLALADHVATRADLRILTNNLRAAIRLSTGRSPVYTLGGQVRDPELSVIGAGAVAQLKDYFLDRVFIGVSGLIESGFYDYSIEDTEVKRVFIERAEHVVVLCDASKFDHRSLARVCGLEAVDVLVTNAAPPPHLAEALAAAQVEVVVAGPA